MEVNASQAETQTESKPNIKDKFTNLTGGVADRFKGKMDKDKLKEQMKHQKVEGLEYVDRDPTNIHRDLKVNFKDVIAEPDGVHSFLNVWCVVPFVKCFVIQMKFISQVWGLLVNTFLDPFFESIGKVFANIRMHITMNQN